MSHHPTGEPSPGYECVIGLEVHVQLATQRKLFCPCTYYFGAAPNSQVCPICLGYPGTLPVLDLQAVEQALRLCLALDARIDSSSTFARKSYFYPDQPKGYQITQHDQPLGRQGRLPLTQHPKTVRLLRLHLEEDAGKLMHERAAYETGPEATSRVDFNRAGVPLLEIVSAPELQSPAEAQDYLRSMRQLLRFTRTSNGNMEEGNLRCDANISLRVAGTQALGSRIEIKNLNSTQHVARALEHEIARQRTLLEQGQDIPSETRAFDAKRGSTYRLRSKEDANDYRYHHEPDLPPLRIDSQMVQRQRVHLSPPPWVWRQRLMDEGRSDEEARTLTTTPAILDYYQRAIRLRPDLGKLLSNWIRTEILREWRQRQIDDPSQLVPPARLVDLLDILNRRLVSASSAKRVLSEMWQDSSSAWKIAQRLDLVQETDPLRLQDWINSVLSDHPQKVAEYRHGKHVLLGFFVGQVMARSGGRAEPRRAEAHLRQQLDHGAGETTLPEKTT